MDSTYNQGVMTNNEKHETMNQETEILALGI